MQNGQESLKKCKKDFTKSPLRLFFSYYKPHLRLFIFDLTCALLIAVADLLFPYVTNYSLKNLLPNNAFKAFFTVMGFLVIAYIIKALLTYFITYYGHTCGVRIETDMRSDLFSHIQSQSFKFFDSNRTGVLMSRITSDLFSITELAHHGPEDMITSILTLVGSFCILLTVRWELAIVLFVLIPISVLFTCRQRKKMKEANVEVKKKTAEINSRIESGISGVRTAKAYTNESTEIAKFDIGNVSYRESKSKWYKSMGIFSAGMEFTMSILQLVVIALGGFFIMKGKMDYIDLITFTLYVATFVTPIRKLISFMELFTDGAAGFSRFLEIMRTEPEMKDKEDAIELGELKGDISFEDVSFAYDDGKSVLNDINLKIDAGECLAIVGPSGGGKTTLCQLIPRFYDVSSGRITVDGIDVRDVTQVSLRKNIGILQQDIYIFADTIMENIRYGRVDATDEEVIEAAKLAEIHKDITEMPEGYKTYVGERGVKLSGGQKQRISIARVFLKNPRIIILDEATSALDSVTEQHIQSALDTLAKGRTAIIIAHRLSTIRNADKIAVVEGSGICEIGSHNELLAKKGVYAGLYEAQRMNS